MKRILLASLISILIFGSYAMYVWDERNSPPAYADDWQKMSQAGIMSTWSYITYYRVNWNRISISSGDSLNAESKWLDVTLWNSGGVDSVSVYAVTDEGKELLLYPRLQSSRREDFHIEYIDQSGVAFGEILVSSDKPYVPPESEIRLSLDSQPMNVRCLRLKVVDTHGKNATCTIPVETIT